MTHTHPSSKTAKYQRHGYRFISAAVFFAACMFFLFFLHTGSVPLRADMTGTQHVCVSVSVIGYDNGDPGSGDCNPVVSSASSSSSSVSSSAASDTSSADSGDSSSAPDSGGTGGGGFRYDRELSHERITDRLAAWAARHRAHGAAPAEPCNLRPYNDVPSSAWFALPVQAFYNAGYLDTTVCLFHPEELANRASFAKLLVTMAGGPRGALPAVPSFNDVSPSAWYFPFMEYAGEQGWMIGFNNCYGTHPCYDYPAKTITRAEAAQTIVRFFALSRNGLAPDFIDNESGQWYARSVQIAADHCILLGDDIRRTVRPGDPLNRAEMVTMLARAVTNMTYGTDCGVDTGRISQHAPVRPTASSPVSIQEDPWVYCQGTTLSCTYRLVSSKVAGMTLSMFNAMFYGYVN